MAETPKTVRSIVRGRLYFAPEGMHASPVPAGWSELGELEIPVTLDLSFGDHRSASEVQADALLAARLETGTSPTPAPDEVPPCEYTGCLLFEGHAGEHEDATGLIVDALPTSEPFSLCQAMSPSEIRCRRRKGHDSLHQSFYGSEFGDAPAGVQPIDFAPKKPCETHFGGGDTCTLPMGHAGDHLEE